MFKLMKHHNQHGYGVSLTKYSEPNNNLSLEAGFVLTTFQNKDDRDKYFQDLQEMTGFESDDCLE